MSPIPTNAISARYRPRARSILKTLRSFFLEMPRGKSFCERQDFEAAYQVFREETRDGKELSGKTLLRAIERDPRAWLVLRSILGMSPGEAAYLAVEDAATRGIELGINQTDARDIDVRARRGDQLMFGPGQPARYTTRIRHERLIRTIVPILAEVLSRPAPKVPADKVHRLDKVDTVEGKATISRALTNDSVPYSELLYERILGRPYATHRDSVSRMVGDLIEDAIRELFERHKIDGRIVRARERVDGFEQAPDALVPTDDPKVIIEAKLTEDDGTARDKVARLQTLRTYEDALPPEGRRQIVAVIDGRGFGHRAADLQKMLAACDGHVYTLSEVEKLVAKDGPLAPYKNSAK